MNLSLQDRFKQAAILLLILLTALLLYTTLHEGGHALVGLAFGGRITDFNVNFFDLSAHVGIDGTFTASQSAAINVAGVSIPVFSWLLLMLLLPKKNSLTVQWVKIIFTMGFLNTLLAWIVIPLLALSNSAPPPDDVTHFITNSGLPHLVVAFAALGLYGLGWLIFAFRIGDLPAAFKQLGSRSTPLPSWKRILVVVAVLAVIVGTTALVFKTLGLRDPATPPQEYKLAATIPLSQKDYQAETVASFSLDKIGDAAIFLRVERLNTDFIDVTLLPPQGDPIQLLHGEDFSTDVGTSQSQYRLPAGESKIILTCPKSAGVLKVYLWLP